MKGLGRNNLLKRVSAFILALLMVFTMMPMSTSVMKAEDGETPGDGSGTETNTSVTYTFDVYEMVTGDGEGAENVKSPISDATVNIYEAEYDGTDVSVSPIATGSYVSEEGDNFGKISVTIDNVSVETIQNFVYEVTYTKPVAGDGENEGTSTVYATVRGTLSEAVNNEISVEMEPAVGFAGVINLNGNPANTSYNVFLLDEHGTTSYETKSRTDGTYVFDDVAAGTYTIEVQAKDDYTLASCQIPGVVVDAETLGIVSGKDFSLIAKTNVSMQFVNSSSEPTTAITIPFGTEDAGLKYSFVDYVSQGETIKYTSDNTDVVTVNEDTGVITTIGVGTANITAEIVDDDVKGSATYTVTVTGFDILGAIVDEDTSPIGNETVYLLNGTVSVEDLKNTDLSSAIKFEVEADGLYTFTNLVPGEYTVAVDSNNYKDAVLPVTLTTANSTDTNIALVAKQEKNVTVAFSISEIDILTNLALNQQTITNSVTLTYPGDEENPDTEITGDELAKYDITYTVDSNEVITVNSETGTVEEIKKSGIATITVSITSDEYKVNTGNSVLQYKVNVWTLEFADDSLNPDNDPETDDTVVKTYGDAAFSTKAILVGANGETKDIVAEYSTTDSTGAIAGLVYLDGEGNTLTENLATAADVKVVVGNAHQNENTYETITATYNGASISYNMTVNKKDVTLDWIGYDSNEGIEVEYAYGTDLNTIVPIKAIAGDSNVVIEYTSSSDKIGVKSDTGEIITMSGIVEDAIITATITGDNYVNESITYTISIIKGTQTGFDWKVDDLTALKGNATYAVTENAETHKLEKIEVTYVKGLQFTLGAENTIQQGQFEYSYRVEYPNGATNLNVATVADGVVTINGAGTAIIKCTATDPNGLYKDEVITYELVVGKAQQVIQWEEIDWINPDNFAIGFVNETITVEYQSGLQYDLGVSGQITDDELTFGFSTLDSEGNEKNDIASVKSDGVVTINKVGDVYVWYKSTNDNKYLPVEMMYHLVVEHGKQPLVWNAEDLSNLSAIAGSEVTSLPETGGIVNITYTENLSYQLDVDGENKDLTYEFTVTGNENGVITLDETNGTVIINKPGEVVISYSATNVTENYETRVLSYTLKVASNPQSELKWDTTGLDTSKVNVSQLTETTGAVTLTYAPDFTTFKIGVAGQLSDVRLVTGFMSSDTSVATVGADGTITILKSGTTIIKYTSTDTTGCYANKTLTYELTINKADQDGFVWNNNVVNGSTITITYDKDDMDRDAQVTATTPAESAVVTYAITSGDAVTITDATTGAIKVNKSGVVTVTASIPATTNYNEKTLTYTLVVNKDNQTIHFDNTAPSFINGGAFTQPRLILDEDEGSDTATIKYSIVRDPDGVISTIEETTGVIEFSLQPGVVVVKATRVADDKYNEASATYTLTVNEWNPLSDGASSNYYTISGVKMDNSTVWYTTVDANNPIKITATDEYQLYSGNTDPTPSTTWSSEINVTDVQEGTTNTINYYIKEKSTGYISKVNVLNFFVDRIAPSAAITVDEATVWEKILSFFTFDTIGQDTPELNITYDDVTSKVKTVYYYISDGVVPMTQNGVLDTTTLESVATWKTYSGTVDLLNENVTENVIYTKVIDNAGNITYAHTNGLIFDGAKPVVTPTIVTKDSNGIYYGNVEINLDVVDAAPYSGVQQITYKVENAGTVTDSGTLFTFQPAQAGNPQKSELISAWNSANYGKNVVVKAVDNNSDNVKVTFTVTDNAGNTSETVVNLMIDITAPVVSVAYDNNNGDTTFASGVYYNANRTAVITVKERHFDTNNTKLTITNTDGVVPTLSGWTKVANGTGNGDDTTYQATVTFAADGDYTFDFSCVDSASNVSGAVNYGTSQAPTAFTIDKTAPIISVSYNNNDALNENYYKADRTATIVIQEHNFDASRVNALITATDDGQTIGAPSISGWSSSGDTHVATITYSSDALYTFDIEYADKAGNAIADFAPQTFYVDKTTPQVSITEIVDLSANNEERIGFVITATDTNFDVFTPVLTAVIQTENGFTTTELDVASISEITNGQVYTVDNLDTDGIYSITCTVVDKAGNAYTEVNLQREDGSTYVENRAGEDTLIMFSVNRGGSVYDVDDNTKDVLDKYYVQSVENDIVIYEVNTNELATYSISLNGEELTEGTDYTVNSTGGNGEWMRYTYTVNRSLFEGEGEYVLVVSSTDGAENNAFSDVKNVNISFVVDRTAPVVTVTGMESDRSYQTDRQIVTLMPTDDGGIIETLIVRLVDRDGNVEKELLNLSGEELREALDANGGTITFELTEGINQNVQIICGDGAYSAEGDANTFNQTFENITVSASAVALFFAGNTLLYIGGGVAATGVAVAGGIFFFRKRKMPKAK